MGGRLCIAVAHAQMIKSQQVRQMQPTRLPLQKEIFGVDRGWL